MSGVFYLGNVLELIVHRFNDSSLSEKISQLSREQDKKIPAISKDYKETPLVGVDGFEPPTLCL